MAKDWLQFFYETMSGAESYVGGGKAQPMENFHGWKGYSIEKGPFRLVDRYILLPNGFSAGVTTQRVDGRLVLHMQYGGFYPKAVTDFLRSVLKAQYEAKSFNGFRGPQEYEEGEFVYRNQVYKPPLWDDANNLSVYALNVNQYMQSAGQEVILKKTGRSLHPVGWHDYHYIIFKP
jgi:hypothetical protein